jgi:hypothetical protein
MKKQAERKTHLGTPKASYQYHYFSLKNGGF